MLVVRTRKGDDLGVTQGASTGAAWLSSARAVRCWVKSRNERNPYPLLVILTSLGKLPAMSWRKVGTTSSHHGPYAQGYTRATMVGTKGCKPARGSQSCESLSKLGSESATRLRERGIASNRGSARHGEYVPGPCTHRPSHHESLLYPKWVS